MKRWIGITVQNVVETQRRGKTGNKEGKIGGHYTTTSITALRPGRTGLRVGSGGNKVPIKLYLSELRRFAKNLNSPLTNSWTNRTTVDPSGVTLRSNKEEGE